MHSVELDSATLLQPLEELVEFLPDELLRLWLRVKSFAERGQNAVQIVLSLRHCKTLSGPGLIKRGNGATCNSTVDIYFHITLFRESADRQRNSANANQAADFFVVRFFL